MKWEFQNDNVEGHLLCRTFEFLERVGLKPKFSNLRHEPTLRDSKVESEYEFEVRDLVRIRFEIRHHCCRTNVVDSLKLESEFELESTLKPFESYESAKWQIKVSKNEISIRLTMSQKKKDLEFWKHWLTWLFLIFDLRVPKKHFRCILFVFEHLFLQNVQK